MVAMVAYEPAAESIASGTVDMWGTTATWRVVLHSDAPVEATDDELADLTQPTGTGYPGTNDVQNNGTRTGDTVNVAAVDVVWTATAGDWTSAQYVSMYDDTTDVGDKLIGSWNYGSSFTLGNGETFTVDFTTNCLTSQIGP